MENVPKKRRNLFSRLLFGILSLIVAAQLTMSYLSILVNPAKVWFLTVFGLLFLPFFILAVFIFIWAVFRRSRMAVVLLLAMLPAVFVAGRFVQFSSEERVPSGKPVKMVSYNVGLFAHGNIHDRRELTDSLVGYLHGTDADIICLQEFYLENGRDVASFFSRNFPGYYVEYYVLTGANGAAGNVTLSRYPLSNKGKIEFERSTNMAIYTDVDIDGTKVRIYNCHFESYNISLSRVVQSFRKEDETVMEDASHKLQRSIIARPKQVDQVLENIEACPVRSVVAGDFNDNPLSYTYMRLRRGRKDAFMEAGKGLGATYRNLWPLLRIDYILYPEDLEAVRYSVGRRKYSDHYPVQVLFETKYMAL